MFKSKIRPIIIPQYEHGRLAGALASIWGSSHFDRPAIDFASFVRGVTFHDWGYGLIDTYPLGETVEADWLKVTRRGASHDFADPVAGIVAKLHLRRLTTYMASPERAALVALIDEKIAGELAQTAYTLEQFKWADRITNFCDSVAFDFCFEEPTEGTVSVYVEQDSTQETAVNFTLKSNGEIQVDPWPFSVSSYTGFITGYRREGYPDHLQPVVINFRVHPQE